MDDSFLIQEAKNGSIEAFEQLIHKYDKLVLSIAYNYRASREDAKDIYQEVFIRVFRGLNEFEQNSAFATWLYRIAVNVCITYASGKKKYAFASLDADEGDPGGYTEELAADCETAENALINREWREYIMKAVDSLPPQQKMVFTLKHMKELKIKEIADIMNCSEGTVKKYLFTAVRKLRQMLKDKL